MERQQQQTDRVQFQSVKSVYNWNEDLPCNFIIEKDASRPEIGDYIGIYEVGWTNHKDWKCRKMVIIDQMWGKMQTYGQLIFNARDLPRETGACYQFVYFKHGEQIRGLSLPFYFRKYDQTTEGKPISGVNDLVQMVKEKVDLMKFQLARAQMHLNGGQLEQQQQQHQPIYKTQLQQQKPIDSQYVKQQFNGQQQPIKSDRFGSNDFLVLEQPTQQYKSTTDTYRLPTMQPTTQRAPLSQHMPTTTERFETVVEQQRKDNTDRLIQLISLFKNQMAQPEAHCEFGLSRLQETDKAQENMRFYDELNSIHLAEQVKQQQPIVEKPTRHHYQPEEKLSHYWKPFSTGTTRDFDDFEFIETGPSSFDLTTKYGKTLRNDRAYRESGPVYATPSTTNVNDEVYRQMIEMLAEKRRLNKSIEAGIEEVAKLTKQCEELRLKIAPQKKVAERDNTKLYGQWEKEVYPIQKQHQPTRQHLTEQRDYQPSANYQENFAERFSYFTEKPQQKPRFNDYVRFDEKSQTRGGQVVADQDCPVCGITVEKFVELESHVNGHFSQ
jgi:hypothetical protein